MRKHSRRSDFPRDLAEGEGFEPPEPLPVQWFSRPPPSTTRPSLRVDNQARIRASRLPQAPLNRPGVTPSVTIGTTRGQTYEPLYCARRWRVPVGVSALQELELSSCNRGNERFRNSAPARRRQYPDLRDHRLLFLTTLRDLAWSAHSRSVGQS